MTRKSRSDVRERILDAALKVSERVGAANLTLDAVAAEAQVSKGGLLYHFASKDLLLKGIVEHHIAKQDGYLNKALANFPSTAAGYVQAFVQAQHDGMQDKLHQPRSTQSFIAAAVNAPELMDSPRRHAAEHLNRLRAVGPGFVDSLLIALALDGLFFNDAFEMLALTETEREAVMQALKSRALALAEPGSV